MNRPSSCSVLAQLTHQSELRGSRALGRFYTSLPADCLLDTVWVRRPSSLVSEWLNAREKAHPGSSICAGGRPFVTGFPPRRPLGPRCVQVEVTVPRPVRSRDAVRCVLFSGTSRSGSGAARPDLEPAADRGQLPRATEPSSSPPSCPNCRRRCTARLLLRRRPKLGRRP